MGRRPVRPPRDTGFPLADAQTDFLRTRRARHLARVASRLRREPDDVDLILPFDEVVEALGRTGQRRVGLREVPLDAIVGTVDRTRDFDRAFRPTTPKVRERWERIAAAMRRGEDLPPVDLLRVGDLHFVRDGHHRVSVARALGRETIEAVVTGVVTKLGAGRDLRVGELALKDHERVFRERVPLPAEGVERVRPSDPWAFAVLAEGVEAWGFRAMQECGDLLDRETVARRWYEEEYVPVVALLAEAGLVEDGRETDAYLFVAGRRYELLRTHDWSPDIVARVRDAPR